MGFPWEEAAAAGAALQPFTRDQVSSLYTSAGSATATVTFPVNPKPGSTVLLAIANESGTPGSVTDNGVTPGTYSSDLSNTSASFNIHVFRLSNIVLPSPGTSYQISISSGGNTFAAGAVSYVAPFGSKLSTDIQFTSGTSPHATPKGLLIFAAFSDSNAASHAVTLSTPVFTSLFTSPAGGSNPGGFGVADFTGLSAPASRLCQWTLGASSSWESAGVGYVPAWTLGADVATTGNVDVATAGRGLKVAEGSNAKQGTAALSSGSAVVANTSVTANSRIFLTSNADGGSPGWVRVSARTAGTSFTITSSSGTDSSTVAYQIFEPG